MGSQEVASHPGHEFWSEEGRGDKSLSPCSLEGSKAPQKHANTGRAPFYLRALRGTRNQAWPRGRRQRPAR